MEHKFLYGVFPTACLANKIYNSVVVYVAAWSQMVSEMEVGEIKLWICFIFSLFSATYVFAFSVQDYV